MDLELSGICENPNHMMPTIKWSLMFPLAKMETVMTGAAKLKKNLKQGESNGVAPS